MPLRRGKGEGAIFQRADGLWVGRIELPTLDGSRRRKQITSKDKGKVIRELGKLKTQLERGGDLPTSSLTVEAWSGYWLREIATKNRRPATITAYKSNLAWVNRAIGKVQLEKVTPVHVRKVLTLMTTEGMSSTYQRNVHSVMSALLQDAEAEGRIGRNPVDLVAAPVKNATSLDVLDVTEAVALLATFQDSPDAYLWATYLLTGARRGEILGLEVDRVGEYIDLSWQLQRIVNINDAPADYEYRQIKGGLYWTRPKSKAGWRIIPLVEPLRSILLHWIDIAPPNPWGLVFTRTTAAGTVLPLDPDYISRQWPEVRKAAGILKHVRLHDVRHTTVDLLYAANVPEDLIQEIVGHSTRAMSRAYRSRNLERLTTAMRQLSASLGYSDSSSSSS